MKEMTYLYKQVNTSDLYHDLKRIGRDNFTYDGAKALMEYLEELASDIGEPIEYDPIGLCCEYTEYEDFNAIKEEYPHFNRIEDIEDSTQVIEFDGGFIIQNF